MFKAIFTNISSTIRGSSRFTEGSPMELLHDVNIPVEKATFGMGCFWGIDSLYGGKVGVIRTKVGYGGGKMANPTYYNIMADFMEKLNKLKEVEGPERVNLTDLTDPAGYPIVGMRFHTHQVYGVSVIVDLVVDNKKVIAFLPKRFARSLCQTEVYKLSTGDYRLKCTGVVNRSPVVEIFKQ